MIETMIVMTSLKYLDILSFINVLSQNIVLRILREITVLFTFNFDSEQMNIMRKFI